MQCEALLVLCHFSVHTAISQTHTLTQTDWHSIFQQTWSFLAVIFPPHGRPPPPRSLLHHVINTSLGMTECNHPPLLLQWHGYLQSHLINSPLDSMHIASISWLIKKKSAEMKQSFAPCAAYDRFDWMQNLQGNLRLPWFSSFCFFFFNFFFLNFTGLSAFRGEHIYQIFANWTQCFEKWFAAHTGRGLMLNMWRGRILAYHTADSRYARRALSVFTAKAKISQMYIPRLAHWLCLDVKKTIGTINIYIYIGMFSSIDVQVKPLGTIQTQLHQFFIQVWLESFLFPVQQLNKMGCTIKTCYYPIKTC